MTTYAQTDVSRDAVIARIRECLARRSGRPWSVTGGRGTAWGWIRIDAPPRRRTADWDGTGAGTYSTRADRDELARLLGLDTVHTQGESVPASSAHYREYLARAAGRTPDAMRRTS